MRAHSGDGLALDVLVDVLEALLAADLGLGGPEQAVDDVAHDAAPSTHARSLRRASCKVLYSAPRVVSRRWARTSIGTPSTARASRTARWCGVRACRIEDETRGSSSRGSGSASVAAASRRDQSSGARTTSRPCHAGRRIATAASSSANL